jgi:beta-glucosidase
MERGEKQSLLRGIGWDDHWQLGKWWYVGNTAPISRLDIPSLNMQDGGQGVRTYWDEMVGTVTCWPSLLALAATWNPGSVLEFAAALGEEMANKGANAILGPSIEVQRVARNGRNFEYLSGEDPFLGARLAASYVRGVQSRGVLAVMKHFAFNHQETNRGTSSSVVDEKTAWELYFPPFQAAVDAGVSAAMCSYNEVNGTHSCSNRDLLEGVLRQKMGFRGFIQSDWWATHSTSLEEGLDQTMPGLPSEAKFFGDNQLRKQSRQAIDAAALRVLAGIHRMNLTSTTRCAPPDCEPWLRQTVTSNAHASLARRLARESIVLLKNRGDVLPLSSTPGTRIAVVGAAAAALPYNPVGAGQKTSDSWHLGDYYSGGGSGHVVAGAMITPLAGIQARAAAAGVALVASASDDLEEAAAAAAQADVTVVVAATTSGEAEDRQNLSLDGDADALIAAVAKNSSATVVILQAPGAVVMPWRDSVDGILMMFLGGQETGSAWADILFGEHAPTGRLPISLPATEAGAIEPSSSPSIIYAEGLATSYRNRSAAVAFPFGHGLTYATFEFASPTQVPCDEGSDDVPAQASVCVEVVVRNNGSTSTGAPIMAGTVAQLYVEMSSEAGHPAPFLKGFQHTGLLATGNSTKVMFRLTARDLSYFDSGSGGWMQAAAAVAHIGESSQDVRHSLPLALPSPGVVPETAGNVAPAGSDDVISGARRPVPAGLELLCVLALGTIVQVKLPWSSRSDDDTA